jgi:enoyl-CoA hydratase/carnithine racemase
VARLRLVRTLRELGVGLDGIRRVAARELPVREVAAAHAAALDAQIQTLRLRRAALGAIAAHADDEEIERMHDLATLTAEERRRIVEDYLDAVFSGAEGDGAVLEKMRMAPPELPDEPTPAQLEAWIEVAQLLRDPGFRAATRAMAERAAAGTLTDAHLDAEATSIGACGASPEGREGITSFVRKRPPRWPAAM